ncbi:MAG TPA: DNA replication/repair protein RecF, partial [Rhodoblastus sp.]|nr:DNA replication/repair protein RecF [Rhodoblastus sp.]
IVALAGENGAGKTNLLEALSLFSPGRGLRRADIADLARAGGRGGFAVSIELAAEARPPLQLGTSADIADGVSQRKFRVDREPVSSARAFADHIRVVWLTPAMDGLFAGPAGERRRFLDRLVLAVDSDHGARVNALERALRNRNRLLEERRGEKAWLDAAEREIAELAIAVASARRETVERLAAQIAAGRAADSPFPWAEIALEGEIDRLAAERPAIEAEELFRAMLRENRMRDAAAGRALSGPQASDLVVRHGPKQCEARRASTGEQKALLVGLVLAHARLVAAMSGIAPLVLLDEIAAHFDPARRRALFEALGGLGGQIWLTGADLALFEDLRENAGLFCVGGGRVAPVSGAPG